ncbi:hypothetical protein RMATCC62417_17810 [Rhizopus microsporus]|nr:hypothetical protein RMATCC62417_17810 [Rhizopus microsporus]
MADLPNPIFSELAFIVNTTDISSMYNIIYSTAISVSCQDFQAVRLTSREYTPTNRVLLNFGYGCQNTTINNIHEMNYNSTNITAIQNMETIALVKRGVCNWSEKISVINSLSDTSYLNITAAFIYDNQTYDDIAIKTTLYQTSTTFPTYSTPLPIERSALNMTDNDLTESRIGVYFVPYKYGNSLKSKLNSTYDATNPAVRTLWSITTYFPQDNPSEGFIGTIRGYLAYIIALAAIFLIGIVFLRWWRIRRLRDEFPNDPNDTNAIHLSQRVHQPDPLPVDIVNALPIKLYEPGVSKNINCAICLDDFVLGKSDVRILPCGHGFCVLCIDPWLTQKSTVCPICKWDCLPTDLRQEREAQGSTSHSDVSNSNAQAINMEPAVPEDSMTTVTQPNVNREIHEASPPVETDQTVDSHTIDTARSISPRENEGHESASINEKSNETDETNPPNQRQDEGTFSNTTQP